MGFNWCCRVEGQCSVMDLTIFSVGMRGSGMMGWWGVHGEVWEGALRGGLGNTGLQSHTQAHSVHTCQKVHETATQFSTIRAISQFVQTLDCTQNTPIIYIYIYAKVYINVILGAC